MSRGTNYGTREVTIDMGREQEAQVGRLRAPPITRSTGLRRRERRFESCRGTAYDLRLLLSAPALLVRFATLVDSMWHELNPRSVPRRSSAALPGVIAAASWRVSAARRRPECAAWTMFEVDSTADAGGAPCALWGAAVMPHVHRITARGRTCETWVTSGCSARGRVPCPQIRALAGAPAGSVYGRNDVPGFPR
jgi:hypothetical protein